jgi:hypothetical protein
LKFLNDQIAQARAQVDYEYDDGDISQTEHGTELNRLSQIAKEASAQAKAGGGTLTRDQENSFLRELNGQPSSAQAAQTNMEPARVPDNLREESESSRDNIRRDLNTVNDEMKRLRVLLDKKLEDGDITKAQRTRMSNHLDLIDKEIQSSASVNGGSLTLDQETTILRQLQRASDSIEKNFVVD